MYNFGNPMNSYKCLFRIEVLSERVIAVCCGGILLYTLLCPGTGIGIIDTNLYGILDNPNMFSLLVLSLLLLNYLLFSHTQQPRCDYANVDSLYFILLMLFSLAIVSQSFRNALVFNYVLIANICTGTTIYLLVFWMSIRTLSSYYPTILFVVFALYSLNILRFIYLPYQHQGKVFYFHGVTRLSLIFDNPNHLGNMLAFGVVYCFGAVVSARTRWSVLALWSILAVLMLGIIQTYSRGAWLSCFVGIIAVVAYLMRRIQRKKLLLSLIILLAIAMLSFLAAPGGYTYVFHRAARALPSVDASVGHRLEVWKCAMKIIHDHWLVGVGIGKFGYVLDKSYKPTVLTKENYASAMNNYITLAAEAGIPTTLLYIFCLVFACVLASQRLPKEGSYLAGGQIGMLCGVYSMLIFACTTYTLGRVYANVLVWSVLGYLAASPRMMRGVTRAPRSDGPR